MAIINGEVQHLIHYADRGLQYGDGVFETIAVREGSPLCWQHHIVRLEAGCQRLRIPIPDRVQLHQEASQLTRDLDLGVLKIIVTRGPGGRGYRAPTEPEPTRILSVHAWPDYPPGWNSEGIRVRVCEARLSANPLLAGIKHLNRLEQVLARSEWSDPEIAEGIMLGRAGQVIEGTATNLFICKDKLLITPILDHAGVAGIMRSIILWSAQQLGIQTQESTLVLNDLRQADELFVCNSLAGIWPIRQLGDWPFGKGPITSRVQEFLADRGLVAQADQ